MRHGRQPQEVQADEAEREQAGVDRDNWDAAFDWADDLQGRGQAPQRGPYAVWRCNWDAIDLFMACDTRWQRDFHGRFFMDYPGADVVMRRKKTTDAVFDQFQLMERAALEILNG